MAIIVQKFGGTSVGSLARIEAVADQVIATVRQGHQVVVVLSAMSGETNRLLSLAKQLDKTPSPRELDMLLSSGEQVSISLLSIALIQRGFSAISLLAHQIGISTNNQFGRARISAIDTTRFHQAFELEQIVVVAGFQGVDNEGNITTLGRGGSDTSAVAMAAAIEAVECQIFTDVDGIYSADPRIVNSATKIKELTYEEALTMASLGAKVLQNRAVEYGLRHDMPIRVLSSFEAGEGSLVTHENNLVAELDEGFPVTCIAHHREDVLVTLSGFKTAEKLALLFSAVGDAGIEVEMVNQFIVSSGQITVQFIISRQEELKFTKLLQKMTSRCGINNTQINSQVAKVSAIGIGLKAHSSVIGQMLTALAQVKVEVLLIATSELNVSVVVNESELNTAISRLHTLFKLDSKT